ncbi:MAG TPA: MarR family transcriptional regulator [Acidimicrobiales bacterium]|nr:MarR family transcriptional regulator [Acidimicrobiales bacterium]
MADDTVGPVDAWSTPALLRAARGIYRAAIRQDLGAAGFGDMPRDGAYVVGGLARSGAPLSALIRQMRMSKQAAGQLVDSLVTRGYIDRAVDTDDRRRLTISLTDRGQEAAAVVRSAVDRVDTGIVRRVGADDFAQVRATLVEIVHGDAGPA